MIMKPNESQKEFDTIFPKLPKKKGKTVGNPPKVQQMPYRPRKESKK
jgi:hypothetical protein